MADRADAELYVRLLDITQNGYQAESRRWLFDHFDAATYEELEVKYPPKSDERNHLVNVLTFFESVSVLVQRGLLDEDVFLEAPFAFDIVWRRTRPILEGWQSHTGPSSFAHVMWLGRRLDWWYENVWAPPEEARPPEG